jgi:hypothetical protein
MRDPDSPLRRMTIAIAAALAIMLAAGLLYVYVVPSGAGARVDGPAIIAAAHAYTSDLRVRAQPVPKSIPLQQLVALGYLKPGQIAAFRGLDATLSLTADNRAPQVVLMRVHMPDGTDLVLLSDGSAQEVAPGRKIDR